MLSPFPFMVLLSSPFEGKILEGEIHGRGAQDHKFPIPPLIIAMDAIREAGFKLKGDGPIDYYL